MKFPRRFIDGYGAFTDGRLKREQDRNNELANPDFSPRY